MKMFLSLILFLQASIALADPPIIWGPNNSAQLINTGQLVAKDTSVYPKGPLAALVNNSILFYQGGRLAQDNANFSYNPGTTTLSVVNAIIGNLSLTTPLSAGNGGTGLASAGAAGNVLTSTGAGWSSAPPAYTGTVTSVNGSGGTTGLTVTGGPITTSGTLTLGGTLVAANGGTGLSSPGTAGNLLTSNGTGWVSAPFSPGFPTQERNSNFAASSNVSYLVDTSGGPVTASLPLGTAGQVVQFTDSASTWGTNNLTLQPQAGDRIQGIAVSQPLIANLSGAWVELSWDSVNNWWAVASNGMTQTYSVSIGQPVSFATPSTALFTDSLGNLNNSANFAWDNISSYLNITGRVGVSTASPLAPIDIRGLGTFGQSLQISNGTTSNALAVFAESGAPNDVQLQGLDFSNPSTKYALSLQPGGGNVGIGTNNPTSLLHVVGATSPTDIAITSNTSNVGGTRGGAKTIAGGGTLIESFGIMANILITDLTTGIHCSYTCAPGGCVLLAGNGGGSGCNVSPPGATDIVCVYNSGAICYNYRSSSSVFAYVATYSNN